MARRNNHIIKWLGGKSSLVDEISEALEGVPFKRYVELFCGSMAIPLLMGPTDPRFGRMIINDINSVLIELYKEIQAGPSELVKHLTELNKDEFNSREEFEKLRSEFNILKFAPYTSRTGALFIYLNKRCFNGMYRENQSGEFNVPYRAYKSGIFDAVAIQKLHTFLRSKNIQFHHVDYKKLLDLLDEDDLVYLDPPYYPCSTNCFTTYHASGFGVKEQRELSEFVNELNKRGIKFILSNAPCDAVRELYKHFPIKELTLKRKMRSAATSTSSQSIRKEDDGEEQTNECIISNIR
jgi:DNA adenine methylase (dam)